ncbi:MAG TPA: hypothetical protein PLG89_05915 [Arenimonas sp.]|nr:hypothetical protein [Arenimonas sp.]
MLATGQTLALTLGFLPYLVLSGYDGWLHEKARRVPRTEQALHALLFACVVALMVGLFRQHAQLAWSAIAVFAVAALADELGFHGHLHHRERRLHHVAYACFAGFLGVAIACGALPWR